MADNGLGRAGPRIQTGEYCNSSVDSFRDPPPANSRWVGWLVGSFVLMCAVLARSLTAGAAAVVILALTAALALRGRRSPGE